MGNGAVRYGLTVILLFSKRAASDYTLGMDREKSKK